MGMIDARTVRKYLKDVKAATTNNDKGKIFEDLICYLFEQIPGFTITHRNQLNVFLTEEVDIGLWNDTEKGGVNAYPGVWIIECKNWSGRVGSAEVAYFDNRLRNKNVEIGVLVAANGITGNAVELTRAHNQMSMALTHGRRIIVITTAEILKLKSGEELAILMKKKFCELAMIGTNI